MNNYNYYAAAGKNGYAVYTSYDRYYDNGRKYLGFGCNCKGCMELETALETAKTLFAEKAGILRENYYLPNMPLNKIFFNKNLPFLKKDTESGNSFIIYF